MSNSYHGENQWGGVSAPWHDAGNWVIGGRDNQRVIKLDAESHDNGASLNGTMVYAGEGPIGFKAHRVSGNSYTVENQWGGNAAPWHAGGTWTIGSHGDGQPVIAIHIASSDNGNSFNGSMTYRGEGPIGLKLHH